MKSCDFTPDLLECGGFTEPKAALQQITLLMRKVRQGGTQRRRVTLPDLVGLDMSQPMLPDVVYGLEVKWDMDTNAEAENTLPKVVIPGVFAHLDDTGDNRGEESEFQTPPTIEWIAKVSAYMIHTALHSLLNENTGSDSELKVQLLEWLFASTYKLGGVGLHIPMYRMPFTAQFCCMVEEIDYEDLCEAMHVLVDEMRERQLAEPRTTTIPLEDLNHGFKNQQRTTQLSLC